MKNLPKCRYCRNPVKRLGAVVCISPQCEHKRRLENSRNAYLKRQALGLKPPPREYAKEPSNGKIERICDGEGCGRIYQTEKTIDNLPRFRFCLECRQRWEDLEAGAMF